MIICQAAYAETFVSTKTKVVESTPTISTSIYASGDQVGGAISFSNAAASRVFTGVISSVTIIDQDKEGADFDVVFFDTSFTSSGDNNAFNPSDANNLNVICVVNLTTDASFSTNGISYATNVNCPFDLGEGNTTLYAALVVRGTPTYTATSDLTLRVGILQD